MVPEMQKTDNSSEGLLGRVNKPLLTVDEYLQTRNMTLSVLKNNIKEGNVKLRVHKDKVYVLDIPKMEMPEQDKEDSQKFDSWYKRIFGRKSDKPTVKNLVREASVGHKRKRLNPWKR